MNCGFNCIKMTFTTVQVVEAGLGSVWLLLGWCGLGTPFSSPSLVCSSVSQDSKGKN